MFFYLPKITGLFWKSATFQCANALPKSIARAHLKQRKNIVAFPGRPVVTRPTMTRQVTASLNQQACKQQRHQPMTYPIIS